MARAGQHASLTESSRDKSSTPTAVSICDEQRMAHAMGKIHRLIEDHGKAEALQFDFDRTVIEAASAYMSAEEGGVGFLYSGWAQSGLPHKRQADDAVWTIQTDHVSLVVQPGYRHAKTGGPVPVGVPYGSRARLICLYLQSEALKNNSREVELGGSLHAWLRKLDIPIGGKSMSAVRDQAERISRCQMSFQIRSGTRTGLVNQHILDTAVFVDDEGGHGSLFLETAKLSETFFEQLKRHPVPIEENAIKAISNNSKAIDIYCWLAYRLHSLTAPTPVSWKALHSQFGQGVGRADNFVAPFRSALELALAVYPDALVDMDSRGLTLRPSKPPVSPKVVSMASRLAKSLG